MLRIHHRVHQGKLSSFGYVTTRDAQRPGKTPTKKNPREMGQNRGNLGTNKAKKNLHDLPTKPKKITIINENTHIIYIDKFIERRSNYNRVKRYF